MFISDLLKTYDPRAIRLGIVAHHYREPWEWHEEIMPTAAARLDAWQATVAAPADSGATSLAAVRAALDDDLDTPGAVAAIDAATGRGESVAEAAALLGVYLD